MEKAVRFILSSKNTQLLSWGEITTMVGSKKVTLPKITRKKITKYIHDDYLEYTRGDSKIVSRSKIFEIIGTDDMKAATAVDYATGILVNDNCERLQALIEKVNDEDMRKSLSFKL